MSLPRRILTFGVVSLSVLAPVAILNGCATTPQAATITDTVARTPQLSTLAKLIDEGGLADTLGASGPYTLFAPSNEAFEAVPANTLADLAGNKDLLKSVLNYHVLAGRVTAAEVRNGNLKSTQGASLAVSRAGNFVTVEDAVVTQPDLAATNGVIHVIDKVLMPPKS